MIIRKDLKKIALFMSIIVLIIGLCSSTSNYRIANYTSSIAEDQLVSIESLPSSAADGNAFCLVNMLPSTGVKDEGDKCYCNMPGPDEWHGYASTCSGLGWVYCQAETCISQACCSGPDPT